MVFAAAVLAAVLAVGNVSAATFPKITTMVSFGDSYTDESRLGYFNSHNGQAPPLGWDAPATNESSSGGLTWSRIVSNLSGIKSLNYAVSGGVCSNDLTPRYCSCIPGYFPDVEGYEVPTFLAEHSTQGKVNLSSSSTIYTIWIGTNDLGERAYLVDFQKPGSTMVDFTTCAINQLVKLYNSGARNFIFQNLAPLHLSPLYATEANGGVGDPNHFWSEKMSFFNGNKTEVSLRLETLVRAANEIFKLNLELLASKLTGAKIALFDNFKLFSDIRSNPKNYLDAPYNVTGFNRHCNLTNACATSFLYENDNRDAFLWFDELHPSERAMEIVAKEIIKTIAKKSTFATYFF